MNDVSQKQKKDSILKSLAILGFVGIIILIAWLSIRLVTIIPSAFTSLASLAESVNDQQPVVTSDTELKTITVTSSTSLLNTKETVTASWGEATVPGSFTFAYQCTDGIAIDLIEAEGTKSIDCDTNYNIGNVTSLAFTVDSEKDRYADVRYTVSFLGTNDTTPRASGTAQITVINSDIKNVLATTATTTEEKGEANAVEETDSPNSPETPITETVIEPIIPKPTVTESVRPNPPKYEQQYTYTIPVSDPNGRIDLGTRYLNLGTITNNTFVPGTVKQNGSGAIQFEVKNYGSKTSGTWTYSVTLPNGDNYKSPIQTALKPNERAILTIGFPVTATNSHTFIVIVSETSDQVVLNDSFQQKVTFAK